MSAVRYIYIGDQGCVFSSADEPTAADLEFAAVGMRTIVWLEGLVYFSRERGWRPIPVGRLVSADIECLAAEAFHAPSEG